MNKKKSKEKCPIMDVEQSSFQKSSSKLDNNTPHKFSKIYTMDASILWKNKKIGIEDELCKKQSKEMKR